MRTSIKAYIIYEQGSKQNVVIDDPDSEEIVTYFSL